MSQGSGGSQAAAPASSDGNAGPPAPPQSDPLIGLLVDDRYRIVSRMARGGMASVYVARDERLDRPVALKIMHPHLAESEQFTARFRQEARAAAKISNPGIVPVYDQGAFHGQGYLVMELIDGPDLREYVATNGPLTLADALGLTQQILGALIAAHQAGVVHRDLKPENVLVARDGTLKITDFGLARAASEVTFSSTGTIMGTVAYLAPEVALRGASDGRTDIYAVGIMLFEMLTGSVPGGGAANPVQLALSRVNADVPPPSSLEPWLPAEVDDLVSALCARDPSDRPLNARDAAALTARVANTLPPELLSHPLPDPGVEEGDTSEDGKTAALRGHGQTSMLPIQQNVVHTSGSLVSPEKRELSPGARAPLIIATILLLLAGVALGVWWWWQQYGPGAYVEMPALAGETVATAEESLAGLGLASTVSYENSDDVDAGLVIRTDPGEGESTHKNEEVTLVVSSGVLQILVPEVTGTPLDEAKELITDAGFEVGAESEEWSDTVEMGIVIRTDPAGGQSVDHRTKIDIVTSKGREPIPIPEVLGVAFEQAEAQLVDLGFIVSASEDYSDDYAIGTVSAVTPAVGSEAFRGDTVTLTRSLGSEYVEVPSVKGLSREDAIVKLNNAGLQAEVVQLAQFFDTVGSQNVAPGEWVRRGTVVTITVV